MRIGSLTVVFSQRPEAAEIAASAGLSTARIEQGSLVIRGLPGYDGEPVSLQLPPGKFALYGGDGLNDILWQQFAINLASVISNGVLIVDIDHHLRELMVLSAARQHVRIGVFIHNSVPRIGAVEYALLASAEFVVFASDDHVSDFKLKYVGPYRKLNISSTLVSEISGLRAEAAVAPSSDLDIEAKRLLIISYFSGDCRAVAVQRINYWLDQIQHLSGGTLSVELATAIRWSPQRPDVHFVPDFYAGILWEDQVKLQDWAKAFIATEVRNSKSVSTIGYYWRYALERYFDKRSDHFDVVLISGNPFSYFDFGAYAKNRWGAKVILDYRDPFANNPRIAYNDEKRKVARYIERGYNFQADLCVSVNGRCTELIEGKEDVATAVIENGFDERVLTGIEPKPLDDGYINFVHAGSLYHDRSPRSLISALDPERHRFHHVGSLAGIDGDQVGHPAVRCYGVLPYRDTLQVLSGGTCGIVFLSQTGFETTTKVYDYLAMGIDILLCTHGTPGEGALAELLGNVRGIYWCLNTPEGLRKFVSEYVPSSDRDSTERQKFSRSESTRELIRQINLLFSPPEAQKASYETVNSG